MDFFPGFAFSFEALRFNDLCFLILFIVHIMFMSRKSLNKEKFLLFSAVPSASHIHLWKPEQFKKHYIYFVFLCSRFFQYGVSNLLLIFPIFIASKKQLHSVLFQIFPKNIYDDDGELFLRKVLSTSGTTARLSHHRKPPAHCENLGRT